MTAARKFDKLTPKATLYIDNVSRSCTALDLKTFVAGLSVRVISCYEVTPRRRRGETPDESRSAFRLTINRSDLDKLLDDRAWPEYVTISEWVYKDPAEYNRDRQEKRGRFHSPPIPDRRHDADDDNTSSNGSDDMETTVIYSGEHAGAETNVKSPEAASMNQDGGLTA